ncbi:hypothetical protein DYB69_17430, partial [Vibrio cholerae]|nr:hypothetical protein [Vibrio cholerae]
MALDVCLLDAFNLKWFSSKCAFKKSMLNN